MSDANAPGRAPVWPQSEDEKPPKKFVSATQISMFLRCQKQWEFRYVDKLKIPPSGAMVQSKAWHRTVETNYSQKIASDKDLPLKDMQELFASQYDEALKSEEIDFEPGEDPGKLEDQGVEVTAAHHKFVAPKVRPLLVEQKFQISLGEDFPYDLLGYWDLVDKDGYVVDNKAYKRAPSQVDADRDIQLGLYSLGYRVSQGKVEKGLRLDAIIKNKTPKAVQISTTRTTEDCRFLLGIIEQVARTIQAGIFCPNPTGWACSPRFCGYWSRCAGKGRLSR